MMNCGCAGEQLAREMRVEACNGECHCPGTGSLQLYPGIDALCRVPNFNSRRCGCSGDPSVQLFHMFERFMIKTSG